MLCLWLLLPVVYSENIIINTKLGPINGTVHPPNSAEKATVYEFLGIQYANAPLGNLRFRPSTVNATKWNGIYDATKFGDICIQGGILTDPQSENCLFLNIWTTKPNNTATPLPVMLFIHGGAFYFGAGSNPDYRGIPFVSRQKDIVYVSINYRLAALGFLSSQQIYDEDPSWKSYGGLNGVHDQITALKWVKKYISDYGGDGNQITIFGESAGGQSVCYLTVSPLAKGLFNRAIIESGACGGPWGAGNTTAAIIYAELSMSEYGLENNLTYLRTLPPKKLLDINVFSAVDGLVLTDEPINIFKRLGEYNDILNPSKLIIGFNTMDGVIGMGYGAAPSTDIEYKAFLDIFIPNKQNRDLIYNYYYPPSDFGTYPPLNYNQYELAWFTLNSDTCLLCPSLFMANQINKYIDSNIVYVYEFGGPGENGSYYAMHGSEVPFVFEIPELSIGTGIPWSQKLSNEMSSAWSNFGRYGVPNITDSTNKVNFEWQFYSGNENKTNVMIFEDKLRINSSFYTSYRKNVCDFWYNTIDYDVLLSICLDEI